MKIVAAGGGSGGHVTPVLAVLNELARRDSKLKAYFVTDSGFGVQAEAIMKGSRVHVEVKQIHAGKFRRYHQVSWARQLLDLPTLAKNFRDLFITAIGFVQSMRLLLDIKPDVVFTKGGFVCVPLGMAAKLLGIPLVIHDSDAHPGLANRILSRWASVIATGSPVEYYPYPRDKTRYIGIPVDSSFKPVDKATKQQLKANLGFHDLNKPLIAVIGGGLGARNINNAMISIAPQLLDHAAIFHVTGTKIYDEVLSQAPEHIDYHIEPFVSTGMAAVIGAADIVVSRAGATALQELAAMAKAVVLVPNPHLTGGHQLKNAMVYEQSEAAIVIDEHELTRNPLVLRRAIEKLLDNPELRRKLGKALAAFARPKAASGMAELLMNAVVAANKKTSTSRHETV